ncbi:transcriptional regulator [Candidatus Saccharibacteria bacterium]|nr:transcriptional regulator [Candidatus Saccharibacteria bacterium]
MFEQLFGSKTRVKLLQLFFENPNRSFYVREITRKIEEQINSVRRELSNLLSIGIITSEANNNRLYYEVNQRYEHYNPLSAIFGGQPMEAVEPAKEGANLPAGGAKKAAPKPKVDVPSEHPLAKGLRTTGHVELALLTGQFTRDDSSGVDLMVVGDINQAKMARFIAELEEAEGKELRYVILPLDNYHYRVQINDRFISNLLESKKQVIINTLEQEI